MMSHENSVQFCLQNFFDKNYEFKLISLKYKDCYNALFTFLNRNIFQFLKIKL
jgi:hypothetical protein